MRWDRFRTSSNVEDRRRTGGGFRGGGRSGLGIGTILILGIVGYALGIDPRLLIGGAEMLSGGSGVTREAPRGEIGTPEDEGGRFVAAILGNTEDVWREVLPRQTGRSYVEPKLVLFSQDTRSGCGFAQAATGPFYCPLDQTVYIDLSFFREMDQRFGGGGEFAYAYVIAHEVGHHVENVLGILSQVQAQQRRVPQAQANALSVRVELMADCLAGVWAHHSEQRWQALEPGDIEQAMAAAAAIGDDRLQRGGRAVPDSFTHGTSQQRVRWLKTGLESGRVEACDTFSAPRP